MKKLILLTLLSIITLLSNAQYVTIPDSNFVSYLQSEFPTAMSGNQMDTTASVIIKAKSVNCSGDSISNLYGIQFFDSLKGLYCVNNLLSNLPKLPNSLVDINCRDNQITTLPKLPSRLVYLYCGENKLKQLPTLPNTLKGFACDYNQLTSLPTLPNTLVRFSCSYNDLTTLPALPDNLTELNSGGNKLISLPSLPTYLESLYCNINLLTELPSLPESLTVLWCQANQLSTLPDLPNSLQRLDCDYNKLTQLPSLPRSLQSLACSYNQLTRLPSLPSILSYLSCGTNKLTSLPFLPKYLNRFECTNNPQLNCIPYFTQQVFYLFDVKTNTQIKCLPKNIIALSNDSSNYLPICTPNSGCPIAYNVIGNVHQDTSINCASDRLNYGQLLSGVKMLGYINGELKSQTFTDFNGFYSFDAAVGDSVEVKIAGVNSSLVSCPPNGKRNATITTTDSVFTNQDFGIKCQGVDIGTLSISGTFRPTRNRPVYIRAGDVSQQFNLDCADNVSGTVTTTIIGSANYVAPLSGALSPTSVVGKTLTYTISDFGVIDLDSAFSIIVNTDTNATVGSDICIKTKVSTSASDINSMNDSLLFCGEVVNSYDPNDKAAFPKGNATPNTWITYTIRFQNTGTDTAYQVIIRDTLSAHLDESTFTYLDGSVRPVVSLNQKAIMFNYPHINLLDSFSNEPESHGWLQYKVQTVADLPPFAEVKNTAYIYFDLNSAVVTNTTTNEYITRSSQDITSCDSAIVNGEIYTSTHTIIDTLGPEVTTTNLVINQSTSRAQSFTSCDSFSYQGSIYYTSLIIRDTFSTVLGCDSLVLTNLTINSVDSKTTLSGATISSSQTGAAYQWLDCDSASSIILSETNQSYTATQNGEYAVEVSQNGCMDTSFCVSITTLGITENSLADVFKIYPNPTAGNITIAFDENQSQIQARVLSITGQELATHNASNTNTLQFDFEAAKGIYFVEITTETRGTSVVRVVKQ
jgi:uncharacterized repeat protein (TIGR01451 family)